MNINIQMRIISFRDNKTNNNYSTKSPLNELNARSVLFMLFVAAFY